MGYWDNQGASPTKVTWKNPQFVPENQRQNGGWYYDPSSGYVQRWWSGGGGGQSSNQGQQSKPSTPAPPSAEDLIRKAAEETRNKWNQVMDFAKKNPLAFDMALAQKMSAEKYNKYYETILGEFINPLKTKVTQSMDNERRLLDELLRNRGYQEKEQKQDLQNSLEAAKGGFAGAGLFGAGTARRSLAQKQLTGEESISDFIAQSKASEEQISKTALGERELLSGEVASKTAQTERENQAATVQDVEGQRGQAEKARNLRLQEYASSIFGQPIGAIPEYLSLA
jgi:hypothetical protein